MRRIVIIILFLGGLQVSAQQSMSFLEVDTTTYQQYLESDWKGLIKTGKEAIDQGFNYYYLQMRIAYAHYSRQEYRSAITYYKNALKLNSIDPVANEYLYYCYLYSGRGNDALLQTKKLTKVQKKSMNISDSVSIVSVGIKYSYASTNAEAIQEDIVTDLDVLLTEGVAGIQKTTNNFHMPKLHLSHRLGKHVILNHSLSYLQKNEFSYAYDSLFFLSPEQIMKQTEYGFSAEIAPGAGWLIRPGFSYLNMKIPLFDVNNYGPGAGQDRVVSAYQNIYNRVFSILVNKEFRFFNIGLSYANSDFNRMQTHQSGLHSSFYPLANLNLYYSFDLYYQHSLFNGESQNNFIFKQLIGFKVLDNLWMEVSNTLPEHMNFYDIYSDISYNNIEKIQSSFNATIIVPIYKAGIKLFGNVGYSSNNSYYFPDNDPFNPINKQAYNSFIITGGMTWTK